ncbi:MAG: mechanosensitive ion channel family protein [Bacteroidia bacterium]
MKEFFGTILFETNDFELTVGRLLLGLAVLIVALLLDRLLVRLGKKQSEQLEKVAPAGTLVRYLRLGTWLIFVVLLLGAIGLPIGEILDMEVFKIGPTPKDENVTYRLTIWSFVTIGLIFFGARLITWVIAKVVTRSREGKSEEARMEEGRLYALIQIIKYVVYVLAILWAFSAAGINITVLLAGSAALLVGVGLGIQSIFNDVISGIVILFEGVVELNDIVEVDKRTGRVVNIKLRTTEIITREGLAILVPNAKFTNGSVINYSHTSKEAMFRVEVGVAYGSDVSLVRKLLLECAETHGDVLKRPKPEVFFAKFGDSALTFHLRVWTRKTFEAERVMSDLRFVIDTSFRKNGIQIPFPQRDLHIIPQPLPAVNPKSSEIIDEERNPKDD